MARIRTMKPEFPQSESMGRISRDARLLFLQLWTICDDEGRTRADSRMLASLLYPYDDGEDGHVKTTRREIETWLEELEREACIVRYMADGNAYLQVCNWLKHQKIDKPTRSKIPAFVESSRDVENHRERSTTDLDLDLDLDQEGKGEEGKGGEHSRSAPTKSDASPTGTRLPKDWQPSPDELRWAQDARPDLNLKVEVESFRDYWTAKPGKDGRKLDWVATFRNWIRRAKQGTARSGRQQGIEDNNDAIARQWAAQHGNDSGDDAHAAD